MAVTPIWKDTEHTVSSGNSPYEYYIEIDGGNAEDITVFHGKAWVRPGEPQIHINVNKIAQDYLTSELPDLRNIQSNTTVQNANALRKFHVKSSGGTVVGTYDFILDWSYDPSKTYTATRTMSAPINGHGCNGMYFLTTTYNYSTQMVTTAISFSPGWNYDNTHCGDYAIYYLSRSGGWCSFLIEGNVTKSDTYNKYNISVPFNNTTLEFQKRTYHNEITTKYEMYTGWLTDEQSANLAENLLGTNKAYLHNLNTGEIMPVLSTVGTAVYKTFRNQGYKRVSYILTVECSQTKHNMG